MAELHLCDLLLLKVDRGVGCSVTSPRYASEPYWPT